MQSENLLRSECGGYESDDSGGGRGAPPGPPGYYPPPQHQYQVFLNISIRYSSESVSVSALLATIHPLSISKRCCYMTAFDWMMTIFYIINSLSMMISEAWPVLTRNKAIVERNQRTSQEDLIRFSTTSSRYFILCI